MSLTLTFTEDTVNNSYEKKKTKERVLTPNLISVTSRRMGRKKQWAEDMQARFPEGTFARIAAVLVGKEDRTDFVREAVERELKRRERKDSRSDSKQAKDA